MGDALVARGDVARASRVVDVEFGDEELVAHATDLSRKRARRAPHAPRTSPVAGSLLDADMGLDAERVDRRCRGLLNRRAAEHAGAMRIEASSPSSYNRCRRAGRCGAASWRCGRRGRARRRRCPWRARRPSRACSVLAGSTASLTTSQLPIRVPVAATDRLDMLLQHALGFGRRSRADNHDRSTQSGHHLVMMPDRDCGRASPARAIRPGEQPVRAGEIEAGGRPRRLSPI